MRLHYYLYLICFLIPFSYSISYGQKIHSGSWGDQGDGTHKNPVLNAVDINWFKYDYDGPKKVILKKTQDKQFSIKQIK